MKKRELTSNQSIALNLIASFISYAVTFGISFFLSPYIVKTVGVDAYGFVSLANNFISYASIITIALNSFAGRFVTIKIRNNDYVAANRYYTSVFYGNVIIASVLFAVAVAIWIFLEKLINIPNDIFWDVKILFAAIFLECIINTLGSVFGIATFATNKLYLSQIRNIEASVIRAVLLVAMFSFCPAKVFYIGITTLIIALYTIVFNIYYTCKLTPKLKIQKKYFDFKAIKELVSSGIWNVVTRLGQILNDGLDLLITNLFIDSTAMGVLSLAKTVPSIIGSIIGTMVSSFSPNFTILYAENKLDELTLAVKQSMKIMGVICNIPIVILIVCGKKFFACWQPTQDEQALEILSILTCAGYIINGGINCIYNVFTVVNKPKPNSLAILAGSVASIGITFVLLKTTDLGIYAIAGVSTLVSIIRNLFFTVPYGAKCLNLKWYAFYPEVLRSVIFVVLNSFINYFIISKIDGSGWINFILCSILTGIISLLLGIYIIFNKEDRKYLFFKLKDMISRFN